MHGVVYNMPPRCYHGPCSIPKANIGLDRRVGDTGKCHRQGVKTDLAGYGGKIASPKIQEVTERVVESIVQARAPQVREAVSLTQLEVSVMPSPATIKKGVGGCPQSIIPRNLLHAVHPSLAKQA
jgi:hypothetical protein